MSIPVSILQFNPGMTSSRLYVPIYGDMVQESDETLVLKFASAINATILDAQAVGIIINDD